MNRGDRLVRFRSAMDLLARWSAVAMLASVPVSKPLFNLASALMLLGWLLAGGFAERFRVLRDNPIALPAALLCALVLIGTAYTDASADYVGRHWYVYSRVLLMLVLVTLFHQPAWRRRGLAAFAAGALLTLASTYANVWFLLPWSASQNLGLGQSHHVFMDYIAQGLVLSFFSALAIHYAIGSPDRRTRIAWSIVAVLAMLSVTHLLQSRTSQVVLLVMLLAVLTVSVPKRWRWPTLCLVGIAAGAAVLTSSVMSSRFHLVLTEARQYLADGTNITSTGARLDMWKHALLMFADSPLWGHGTSGYRVLAEKIFLGEIECATNCIHPHNQFLFFGVEFGIAGIVAYWLLLYRPFRCALREPVGERLPVVAFLTIMLVDSFINAPLWVTTERQFFTVVLPLLVAGYNVARGPRGHSAAREPT